MLVDHALSRFSTDNLSCMIVRFDSRSTRQSKHMSNLGVDSSPSQLNENTSEADAILSKAKVQMEESADATETASSAAVTEENIVQSPETDTSQPKAKS